MKQAKITLWLGLSCVIGSVVFSAFNVFEVLSPSMGSRGTVFNPTQFRVYMLTAGLVEMPSVFCGQLGYHRLVGRGNRRFGKVILVIAGIGCAIFTAATLYSAATLADRSIRGIGIVLNILLAPTLWFFVAIRAKKIAMWKRVWPLVMGLIPWFMFGVAVPLGFPRFGGPAVVGLFWLVFGVAVVTEAHDLLHKEKRRQALLPSIASS